MYIQPLWDIVRSHDHDGHDPCSQEISLSCMETFISDVKRWMLDNKLKLNDSKMELLTFSSSSKLGVGNHNIVNIGEDKICLRRMNNNMGVLLDDQLHLVTISFQYVKQLTYSCSDSAGSGGT